jgi:hypothetical protein
MKTSLLMLKPQSKSAFDLHKAEKKIPVNFGAHYFFMNHYSKDFYKEILECYNYETRNSSVYGNAILCKVEPTKGGKKLWTHQQRDENHI